MSGFDTTTTELQELRRALFEAKLRKGEADIAIKGIQERIGELLGKQAQDLLASQGKLSGDATFETEAGKFKASVSKTVKWDSAKLQGVAATMPWQEVVSFFKIDFSVPEANYKSAQALRPELAGLLDDARTTKYGELVITPVE